MSLQHLTQRVTSMNGIDIPDSENLRVPAGEIRAAGAEADTLRRERDELAARLAEIERWKRIAENAQAVTTGGDDKGDYFEVPSHLIAALALALDEGLGAQGQAGAASMSIGDALGLHAIADGTKIRPACDWPGKCKHQLTPHRKKA